MKDNKNAVGLQKFVEAMRAHIEGVNTRVIEGTFKKAPARHYVDPETRLNVMTTPDGNFHSCWRLSPEQLVNLLTRGSL